MSLLQPASRRFPGPVGITLVFNRGNAFGLVPVAGEVSRWGLAAVNIALALGLSVTLGLQPLR